MEFAFSERGILEGLIDGVAMVMYYILKSEKLSLSDYGDSPFGRW